MQIQIIREAQQKAKEDGIVAGAKWAKTRLLQVCTVPVAYSLARLFSGYIVGESDTFKRCKSLGELIEYGTEESFTFDPPDYANKILPGMTSNTVKCSMKKPFVGSLSSVHLIGPNAVPVHENKILLLPKVSPQVLLVDLFDWARNQPSLPPVTPTVEIETAVLLHNQWNTGYYHWTVDSLSKIQALKIWQQEMGTRPKIILGPNVKRFQTESLRLLGYDSEDWVQWKYSHGQVNNLVIPSNTRQLNRDKPSPVRFSWLREQMTEQATKSVDLSQFSSKIFISRKDANRRQINNREEVNSVLDSYGLESYTPGEMTVKEQVSLFSQADVIVGPHGAGLTNMLYSKDAAVVELFRGEANTRAYYDLAQEMNHWYGALTCETKGKNFTVDISEFEQLLRRTISSKSRREGEE